MEGSGYRDFRNMWGFPKSRSTFLGVPITRIIVFGGSTLGSPLFWETTMWYCEEILVIPVPVENMLNNSPPWRKYEPKP